MHVSNLKIGIRLAILAGLLLFAVSVVGVTGWRALSAIDARAIKAADQAAQMQIAIDTARHAQVQFKIQIQEWKNTLLRGNDPAQFDKYRQAFIKTGEAAQAGLGRLADLLAKNGLDRAAADESRQALVQLQQKYLDALKQYDTANPDSARVVDAAVKGMDRGPTEKIDAIVATVLKQSKTLADGSMAELNSGYRDASTMLLSLNILAVLFGIATTVWLGRSITRPLRDAVTVAKTVASGDLTSRIDVKSRDETGELLQALKDMNDSLVRIVHEVRGGTDTIASATRQISSGNAALSSRTEAQAASLQETASSMEELTSTVKQNADNARQANQLATTASEIAVQGGAVVAQVVDTMGSINASAKKIVDIISIIDGIAFQTNILALNAAVEAARAGEQGRGFAVVASEVRSLAQRSAQAAKEIKILIDDSVHQVDTGSRLVDRAGTTMHEVVTSIKRVTDIMSEITAAGQEQSAGIDQIHQAIVHVDEATQQNAALVEESAAASEALQTQTHKLEQTVGVFRLDHGAAATAVAIRG